MIRQDFQFFMVNGYIFSSDWMRARGFPDLPNGATVRIYNPPNHHRLQFEDGIKDGPTPWIEGDDVIANLESLLAECEQERQADFNPNTSPSPPELFANWRAFRLNAFSAYEAIAMALEATGINSVLLTPLLQELPNTAALLIPRWNNAIGQLDPTEFRAELEAIAAAIDRHNIPLILNVETGQICDRTSP